MQRKRAFHIERENVMVDPKKAAKLIRQHFEELTTEQFVKNLRDLSHEVVLEQERKEQERQEELQLLKSSSELEAFPTEK